MMKKVAYTNTHTKRIKMKTVTKDGIRNSTNTHRTQGTEKKEFVSVFMKPLFFTLLTENDMNSERSEKRMRDRDKNK